MIIHFLHDCQGIRYYRKLEFWNYYLDDTDSHQRLAESIVQNLKRFHKYYTLPPNAQMQLGHLQDFSIMNNRCSLRQYLSGSRRSWLVLHWDKPLEKLQQIIPL